MRRAPLIAGLIAGLLLLPGCKLVCFVLCHEAPPASPAKGTRDTPERAVDYLVNAFRDRHILDLYESLHPRFIEENGGFGSDEFTLAYEKYESEFLDDAETLAAARRTVEPWKDGLVRVVLVNEASGAALTILFANVPKIRVLTTDEFVPEIKGEVDKAALVRLADGRLRLPPDFALSTIRGVQKETVAGLTGKDVVRVEIHDDWLVRDVPPGEARNIRFLDRLKELTQP